MAETPADVFHLGLELIRAKDMPGFIALFADDAVLEFPFALPGRPQRLVGRRAIHEYLIGYPDLLDVREITDLTLHQTTDDGVIIAEFAMAGVVVATGRPYRQRYISVLTVRGGRLVHYRDYWNPVAAPVQPSGAVMS